jgi:predicted DNA-binding transcriptional regulator AlpA
MTSRFVRFRDLKARGIAASWAQLDNLIKKYGFPPGRMLGPATRAWDLEEEIEPWLAARPVAGPPPRGAAKVAKDRLPEDRRRKPTDEVRPPNDLSPASS